MTVRATPAGDERAEARIARDVEEISAAVEAELGSSLRAVLLVGGYARGEGGLIERDGALAEGRDGTLGPYNDYDLVAVVRGPARSFGARLAALAHAESARRGVEVDLWPISESELGRVPRTLFWLDVGLGGARVVRGDETVISELARHAPRDVPLEEVGRLLANRAVGLALTNLESDPDRDLRRARHGHKAVLACGDARLLAAHHYRATVRDRAAELDRLATAPGVGADLVRCYQDAARFRERPDRWAPPAGEPLSTWYERTSALVCGWHLGFEAWRVGSPSEPRAAAAWNGRYYPVLPDVRPGGSVLASLRARARDGMPMVPWVGHPRERLARVAIALAYAPHDPEARRIAARLLGPPGELHTDDALHARLGALARLGG